jgi:choline kinase
MRAIIYAAGVSRRLQTLAVDGLKGLLPLGKKRIIEYQLDWISDLSVSEIVIVIGYEHEEYRRIIGHSYRGVTITYVYNEYYKTKGNMLSLWCARDYCDTDVMFTTSDLVCDPINIREFVLAKRPNKILVDTACRELFHDSDPVKACIENDRVTGLQKQFQQLKHVDGVAIGVYQFGIVGISKILDAIEKKISAGIDDLSLYHAIDAVLDDTEVFPIQVSNSNWCDVDTPEEYYRISSSAEEWFDKSKLENE